MYEKIAALIARNDFVTAEKLLKKHNVSLTQEQKDALWKFKETQQQENQWAARKSGKVWARRSSPANQTGKRYPGRTNHLCSLSQKQVLRLARKIYNPDDGDFSPCLLAHCNIFLRSGVHGRTYRENQQWGSKTKGGEPKQKVIRVVSNISKFGEQMCRR